ncbi:MAG: hypothetical protein Q8M11_22215 [Sulfuritalea sp.]|nr:hypothetical protein [Sulfuritalea sp.]
MPHTGIRIPERHPLEHGLGHERIARKGFADLRVRMHLEEIDAAARMPPDVIFKGQELICAVEMSASQNTQRDAMALAEAYVQASRTADIESTLVQLRGKCDELQKEAASKAVELWQQNGEAETLRSQMRELMRALKVRKS